MNGISLFVNTSDGFHDCWDPFFTLWEHHAGEDMRRLPTYLNTERALYERPSQAIECTRVWPTDETERPSWSTCLLRGLKAVQEPVVLYMQEDYFLTAPVDSSIVQRAAELLARRPELAGIYLNELGPQYRRAQAIDEVFVEIVPPARYLLSTQAALWRKEALASLARPWENGWMFEKFGTLRAARSPWRYASVSHDVARRGPIVEYVYTGVMKGRWHHSCAELFARHGIVVDFSRRGFYVDGGRLKTRLEVLKKMVAEPAATWRSIWSLL